MSYKQDKCELDIFFTRQASISSGLIKTEKWLWFFEKMVIPTIITKLKVYNVESYQIKDYSKIGNYMFENIKYNKKNLITIIFIEDMKIEVSLTKNIVYASLSDIKVLN